MEEGASPLVASPQLHRASRSALPHPVVRLLVVACSLFLVVTIAPATALADPPAPANASDAARLVAELGRDLEVLQEEQNTAQVTLDQHIAESAEATVALGEVNKRLTELNGRLRGVARSAFSGNQLSGLSAILASGSPQEFLDRVNTLEYMSGRDGALLDEATLVRAEATSLNEAADAAVNAAQAAVTEMAARRAELEAQIQSYQQLFDQLSAEERGSLVGGPGGGQAPPGEIIAPSEAARIAVETAYAQLGDSYSWGAAGPDSFDCSGLTMYSYAAAGVSLPHSSRSQSQMGIPVSRADLQPGDLVFYYSPVSHVAIYVGDGQIIHASTYGKPVSLDPVDPWGAYNSARRIAGG